MINNKKRNPVVTELFIKGKKLNISIVFITLIVKIPNKRELQKTALNHSSDIDFQDFLKFIKNALQNRTLFWLMIRLYHQIIH